MSSRLKLIVAVLVGLAVGAAVTAVLAWTLFLPPQAAAVEFDTSDFWTLRSQHFPYGMPRVTDARYNFVPQGKTDPVPGVSVLVREGFALGHCDHFKVPLWVSYHWTRKLYEVSETSESVSRRFKMDLELPEYARGDSEYHLPKGGLAFDRGHMARDKDNLAWGEDNELNGDLMSNIIPQKPTLNQRSWLALEDAHRRIVASGTIKEIWVLDGAAFDILPPQTLIGNGIAVPESTYKVICWFDAKGKFQARGYLYNQDTNEMEALRHLVPISEIETRVGICFFPELNLDERSHLVELRPTTMWQSE